MEKKHVVMLLIAVAVVAFAAARFGYATARTTEAQAGTNQPIQSQPRTYQQVA